MLEKGFLTSSLKSSFSLGVLTTWTYQAKARDATYVRMGTRTKEVMKPSGVPSFLSSPAWLLRNGSAQKVCRNYQPM
jgi:hypothetical protein